MARAPSTLSAIEATLREVALGYPGAVEEFPWGERVIKVARKIFVFVGLQERELYLTAKLPSTGGVALSLPFAEPTGYNLGRSGWVSARFDRASDVPLAMLVEWIDESYRAVAPAPLVKTLDGAAPPRRPKETAAKRSVQRRVKRPPTR
jgi:predicted DNA-binding protein (MmcQ/YjbR family)